MPSSPRRFALGVVAPAAALMLTSACAVVGSTADDESPRSARTFDASLVEQGYKGSFEPAPTSGPTAQDDRTVWYVSCGQAYVACATAADSFQAAGEELGWDVTIVDGKADPSTAANLIRQGVAADVDGIALFTYDCPGIKSALSEARAAEVPVVNFGSLDCDDAGFGGGEKLFAASLNIQGSDDQGDFWSEWGRARAAYAVASLGGEPGAIIDINETSQRSHQYIHEGFTEEVARLCDDCEVVDTPYTFAQVPNRSSAIFKAALTRNPDAQVVAFEPDALMGLGLQTVLAQSGRGDLIVDGGEGLGANLDLIRAGDQNSSTFIPYDWYVWGLADTLNRVLAGETELPSQGGGFLYIDKDHNLPAEGDQVEISVDYRSAYQDIWSGQ